MAIYLINEFALLMGPVEIPEIPGLGTSIPGNAVELEEELPPPVRGHLWVWSDGVACQQPDRRGLVYHIQTGAQQEWEMPGELPQNVTTKPWPGRFHIWHDGEWKLDEQAQIQSLRQQALIDRDALLAVAAIRIAPLEDALDLGKATDDEKATLRKWKAYRVDLNRIEDQEQFPLKIEWPPKPEDIRAHRTDGG